MKVQDKEGLVAPFLLSLAPIISLSLLHIAPFPYLQPSIVHFSVFSNYYQLSSTPQLQFTFSLLIVPYSAFFLALLPLRHQAHVFRLALLGNPHPYLPLSLLYLMLPFPSASSSSSILHPFPPFQSAFILPLDTWSPCPLPPLQAAPTSR